jgi:hypothetical protein
MLGFCSFGIEIDIALFSFDPDPDVDYPNTIS